MPSKIRIMTWNVGIPCIFGSKRIPYRSVTGWIKKPMFDPRYIPLVRERILENDCDIVFLQEINEKAELIALAKDTEYKPLFCPHTQGVHQGLLTKEKPVKTTTIQTKSCRDVYVFEFKKFVFVGIHLNAFFSKKREHQVEAILAQTFSKPMLLMGDFNLSRIGNIFLLKRDKQLYEQFVERFTDMNTENKPTAVFRMQFDYAFTDLDKKQISSFTVDRKKAWIMDHYAIIAELLL